MTDSRTSYGRSTSRHEENSRPRGMAATDDAAAKAAAKEEKQRKMRERLEQWRKRKEQEKQQSEQPMSQASSVAGDDSPNSVEAGFESLPRTSGASTPQPPQPEVQEKPVQEKPFGKTLGLKRPAGVVVAGPPRKFGKLGLKPKRLLASLNIKGSVSGSRNDAAGDMAEIDPLEAYMQNVATQVNNNQPRGSDGDAARDQVLGGDDDVAYGDDDDDDGAGEDPEDVIALAAKRLKKKDLAAVDHSKMNYEPFKKDFYIEPAEEVDMMRVDLGGVKIRGIDCPKPAQEWSHFGLPAACADVIKHQGAQAVPAILSGRDVIGGKTLAFILPMLRHIKAQRGLESGEGPIGLLAVQIHRECKPFLKPLGLHAVCAYGGSAIKDQIGELKRGAEIVVCTPGRLIDLLCANSGRVTNLHRVTYLVLDEADRMFDMGFEPQVTKIVQSVRPSRQTVLFSATFPRQMEALARKILRRPLEIVVGGRSLIPPEVAQHVEVVESKDKFVRLLAILGDAFNLNKETLALVFVDRQEAADGLLRDLMRRGYVCNSLHGGKDQTDRDQAVADFKNRVFSVLIATSVAARGLDVRGLNLVVNYDCPNHMEDLVHRVGRTGRAGNKGDAFTEVVKAMKLSHLTPPTPVQQLADQFLEKVRAGTARHSSKKLDKDRDLVKKIQKVSYGHASGEALDEDEDEDEPQHELDSDGEPIEIKRPVTADPSPVTTDGEIVRRAATKQPAAPESSSISAAAAAALQAAQAAARRFNVGSSAPTAVSVVDQINQQLGTTEPQPKRDAPSSAIPVGAYGCELDINDYHQKARWRATNRETLSRIIEQTGAAITTRGVFAPEGERKLYLSIEADSERAVELARNELKRILTEATLHIMEQEARGGSGRYSVV
ncbi:P-loop containing nucleoside triphosphate hydrolase protein [Linderina pennispora]|uniref:RNA helicase n=1 Tax=Linderina pennispora TaxID=61395 RepID=A0A1Y1W6F3_9FUNG|nr:P-loop containing nucleoside triphosphate hydrolase protein [Linderina pennispora]ORX68744.1 P-loop containing nucleoside triphosphate hydrolase protein [Linderina pennispora]